MKFIAIILSMCVCFLLNKSIAQPVYPKPFKTLNVTDGLPQSFISGLVQDSTGFIWIGTRDGLARYDGRKFKIFRHIPEDSTSLADNVIASLYLDKKQRLWIYYEAGDIDVLNTSTEILIHLTKVPVYKSLHAALKSDQSFADAGNGDVWLLGSNGNIYICNIDKQTLRFYSGGMLGLSNDNIAAIKQCKTYIILIGYKAFFFFNNNRKLLKTIPYTFKYIIDSSVVWWKTTPIAIRKNGDIIIVDYNRLIIYKAAQNTFTIQQLNKAKELTDFCIAQDDKEQIFFDHDTTLYSLSPENNISIWKPAAENPAYGFKSMLFDKSGVLWLGGNGSGIQLYDLRLPRLSGIAYKKVFQRDVLMNVLHVPQHQLVQTSLAYSQGYFTRWAKGLHNDLWLARAGDGIVEKPEMYHYINGNLEIANWHYADTITAHHKNINGLAVSPKGELWGIDFNMRPVYFDTLTNLVTVYPSIDSVNYSYPFTVSSLLIDKKNRFWITTAFSGLFLYDKPHNKVVHYTAADAAGFLPTNQLMNIVQDPKRDDILWIGSLGGGLIQFNKQTGRCFLYTTKQGLPNNTVYAIVADARGMLWCSSNKGIFSFDPSTGLVLQKFTSKDGLPGDEFNRYHFFELPDGNIVFGGVDGYTVFNPLTLSKDNFQPTVALTGMQINNVASDFGNLNSPFKQAINSLDKIKLNYRQNFLTFSFAALEYNITEKLQYRYMLQSFDKGWVNVGNNNEAVYTKLPPGNYTLKIDATNTAGEWSNNIKTLTVFITPPFWQTWWFILLVMLVLATTIYALVQSRVHYIRKQERQKMKFEHEAASLKAQALRAQMNPHFIFNCLNSIKALIQEDKKKEAVIYLTTFSKLIRSQLNNAEQEVSLHDELETCRLYAQLEALRFGDKIITEFKIDKNADTRSLKVPPLLLQPFIENAIWHGVLPKQNGKVTVSVVQENGSIICTIDDDGIGREMAMNNKLKTSSTYESKGMGLVRNRLTMHNNINPNQASVEVIDKKENNKPAGTLIIIKFKQEA